MKQEHGDVRARMLIEAEQDKIRKAIKTLQRDSAPPMVRSAEDLDNASTTTERYNIAARRACLEAELIQIEEALSRMNDGFYRICRQCGHLIEPDRLQANPFATLCIGCKREEERKLSSYRHLNR